jgi:hypothetical protein
MDYFADDGVLGRIDDRREEQLGGNEGRFFIHGVRF